MSVKLTDVQRARLVVVSGALIPSAEGMPAANEVDPQGAYIDRVLELRPELSPAIVRGLATIADSDIEGSLARLNSDDPEALGAIGVAVTGAYYIQPEVHKKLGYPGQQQRPAMPEEENDYMQDELLKPVIDRGSIYRPAPA